MTHQMPLFPFKNEAVFPTTRYQGSKRQPVEWIWINLCDLKFDTVLDVFGGTGAVSYLFKTKGKTVFYNDYLTFNYIIGLALIENAHVCLTNNEVETILTFSGIQSDFIQSNFQGIFFTDDENAWLDRVIGNINHHLTNPFKKALAFSALFQACIIKRPYNLFHRANLYMRRADVRRTFGNKTTWDTPFETHFRQFVSEMNAAVFDNQRPNKAMNLDAFETATGADLVYLDPPYLNAHGVGVDYREFYHFLEGMVNYNQWGMMIDYHSKHRRLLPQQNVWNRAESIFAAFETVISRHRESMLVVSYRDDGIPSKKQLIDLLGSYKSEVKEAKLPQKYALSKRKLHETLLIAV